MIHWFLTVKIQVFWNLLYRVRQIWGLILCFPDPLDPSQLRNTDQIHRGVYCSISTFCLQVCSDIINPAQMSKLLLKMSGQEIKWERPNGEQGKGHRDWYEAVLTYNRDGVLRFNDRGVHRYDVYVNFWIPYPYAHTGFAKEILLPLSHLAIGAANAKQIRQIWKHNPPT